MGHKKFKYVSLDDFKKEIDRLDIDIPLSENMKILDNTIYIGGETIPNALALHPMEGADGTADGKLAIDIS